MMTQNDEWRVSQTLHHSPFVILQSAFAFRLSPRFHRGSRPVRRWRLEAVPDGLRASGGRRRDVVIEFDEYRLDDVSRTSHDRAVSQSHVSPASSTSRSAERLEVLRISQPVLRTECEIPPGDRSSLEAALP